MEAVTEVVSKASDYLWNVILIILLCGTGIYFTIRLKFIQIRKFGEGFKLVFGNISLKGEKGKNGEMTTFQSLATAIAAQVGTGNLAGAATALIGGGPGAIFWMWVSAFFGMSTIYAEATLAQQYKVQKDGEVTGGPVYYIRAAFKGAFGKALAAIFAILIVLALGFTGNMVQSNSIGAAFSEVFSARNIEIPSIVFGLILAAVIGFIFLGGVNRLASVVEKIVPIMAGIYIVGSLVLILMNITALPEAIKMIFVGAFNPEAVVGAGAGIAVREAIRFGVARGLFSNEAGMGSAPNAAATAAVSHPVKQGLIQALSVFTDTLIICSCTAFIILLSDVPLDGTVKGIQLTQMALSHQIGSVGGQFIAICILLFAFSSIVGNYSYCETNLFFISKNKTYLQLYRIIVGGMVMFGSIAALDLVWNIADLFMAIMAITNLIAIVLLGKIALKALQDYNRQRRISKKNIIFKSSSISELKDSTSEWE